MNLSKELSYETFSYETKNYLNKAIDVYAAIENKSIIREIGSKFSKLDKKAISLYIASFLVDGDLKNLLSEHDDIKLDDLFTFCNLNKNDIKQLDKDMYIEIYDKSFKLHLVNFMKEHSFLYTFNKITPEVMIIILSGPIGSGGSDILNCFGKIYGLGDFFMYDHLSFNDVINYAIEKGYITEKNSSKKNNNDETEPYSTIFFESSNKDDFDGKMSTDAEPLDLNNNNTWAILDEIKAKFIGQEIAVEDIFYNIINNQFLASMDNISDGERSIIFIDGPTGTGKTAITREITENLNIPFVASSATNYSQTGYVGADITDNLKELYRKSNGNLGLAQRGIIVFDEFDKITYNPSRIDSLEMKRAVQQQLLNFMGGGKYKVNGIEDEFDTSKLTFICLGALTDLRTKKTENKKSIGFGNQSEEKDHNDYNISPQDLIDIGLERELVGRFNTYLHTNEYSKEDLFKILKQSTISPLIGFERWITSIGKNLIIDEGVYEVIVDAAYDLNTGARSLQTVMNNIRTRFLKEVLRGDNKTIHLDTETIISINTSTFSRKGRR